MKENLPWTEKYRARFFSDIKGQDIAIQKTKDFLKNFPKKKSLILHGPCGIGKTSLVHATSNETDSELLELNASDLRDKKKIAEIIGNSVQQKSLFKKSKIILIDEVDGISTTKDKGGLTELLGLIEKSCFPILITANNIWDKKFNPLRTKSEIIQLKDIDYKIILGVLREISNKENLNVSADILTSISVKSKGDLRAAINDLQIISQLNETSIINPREINERNKEESIFTALQHIFKNSNIDESMIKVFDEVDMSIDELFLWMDENIPLEYKGEELVKAYDALSQADVFRGRIYRKQYWRFLIYEYFLLSGGIAASKDYNKTGFTSYKKPSRILKIWLNNQRTMKKKSICIKYAKHTHISIKRAMRDFLLIKTILQNEKIRKELKLDEEEINYLNKLN
ncbi:MAG: replication factor C large subunit [Candidatus Nanoarchaeia archaeon]|nr:replication factor C large subunit [Candidatus Nanoarchaeia archaeon]